MMIQNLAMTTQVASDGNHLTLTYRVVNHTNQDAYLLNRLYRTTPTRNMSPEVLYMHLDYQTATMHLVNMTGDTPTNRTITAHVSAFVTPVRAGSTFEEIVRVHLPLRPCAQ